MTRKQNKNLIDVHAHILPGADDGARTMDEACKLVKQARESGFRTIVVTPHYSRRRGAEGYAELAERLGEEIKRFDPEFQIFLGQETYYHEELVDRLKEGKALTMAGSRYVLVEFDTGASFHTMERAMRQFVTSGYVPVLAHMERYRCLRDEKNLESICGSGCLMQMNYESLEGHWFQSDVRWCRKQVKEGRIHFLGTDMHRTDYRPPEITKSMKWLNDHIDRHSLNDMTYRNARRMIKNEKIR